MEAIAALQHTLYCRVKSHWDLSASGTTFILLPNRSLAPEPDMDMHNVCLVHKALALNVVGNQMTRVNHQKDFHGAEIAKRG